MKKTIIFLGFFLVFAAVFSSYSSEVPAKTFTKDDITKLSGSYLEGKLDFKNPVMVDVDNDGDFDALKFDNGNVEYYKNVGTLENPSFILENKNYDSYGNVLFIEAKIPYPLFFADTDGDGDMDMFVIKDRSYNKQQQKFEYKVSSAENTADLSTGTLITIILILVIVLLILAIVR
jgi:hypothetical protein